MDQPVSLFKSLANLVHSTWIYFHSPNIYVMLAISRYLLESEDIRISKRDVVSVSVELESSGDMHQTENEGN